MRQPDNLPAFCRVHRNGRPLIMHERLAQALMMWPGKSGGALSGGGRVQWRRSDPWGEGAYGVMFWLMWKRLPGS